MPIPQLTPFPDPPRIYQPEEEFDAKADEMAGHLPVLVNEINAMVAGSNAAWADINIKTSTATNAATTASNAAAAAAVSASNAELFKQAAAGSANSASSSAFEAASSASSASNSAAAAANSANTAASATNADVNIYVDLLSTAGATANGSTWALAYNNLLTALQNLPTDKIVTLYLKDGQIFELGDANVDYITYVPIKCRRLVIHGATNRPKIKVNHIVHANSFVYPAIALVPGGISDIVFTHINIEINPIAGTTASAINAQNSNTRFIYPGGHCHLHLSSLYTDWVIPAGYAAISPYVTCASISAQLGYGSFVGGGDVIDNLYLCCPISLNNYAYNIATDTYWLSVARVNHNIDAPGAGTQLARSFV